MAPSTRSGKGLTVLEVAAHKRALRAGPVNTTGLPGLPPELLLEIVAHFPSAPLPVSQCQILGPAYLERQVVLRTLSQMCRSLRRIFWPLVWERVEACAARALKGTASVKAERALAEKELSVELVRQLEIVTVRDPSLAKLVKIVNVFITNYSTEGVLKELARCMKLFSNLETVQIMGRYGRDDTTRYRGIFRNCALPSVRRAVLSDSYFFVLKSIPNVRHIDRVFKSGYYRRSFLDALFRHCPLVERMKGFDDLYAQGFILKANNVNLHSVMSNKLPQLHTFEITISKLHSGQSRIQQLAGLPKLACIVFHVDDRKKPQSTNSLNASIGEAVKILRAKGKEDEEGKAIERVVKIFENNGAKTSSRIIHV